MSMPMQQTIPRGSSASERRADAGGGVRHDEHPEGGERRTPLERAERLARSLGWLSLGLGVTQITAPRTFARVLGVRADKRSREALRAVGAREIAAGIGILTRTRTLGWMWARLLGDAMDLSLLGSALRSKRAKRGRVAAAASALIGLAIVDTLTGRRLVRAGAMLRRARPERVMKAVTVNRSIEDVYRFCRDVQNLPRFMAGLDSVRSLDERRSRWVARTKGGKKVEWDVETIEDRPKELIAWRSLDGANVVSTGSIGFAPAPGGRGTEVRVEVRCDPSSGAVSASLRELFGGALGHQLGADLHRFKQLMEVGEVVSSHAGVFPAAPPEGPPPARTEDEPRPSSQGVSQSSQGGNR